MSRSDGTRLRGWMGGIFLWDAFAGMDGGDFSRGVCVGKEVVALRLEEKNM